MSDHYDVEKSADGASYQFTTTSGLIYFAYFTEFYLLDVDGNDLIVYSFGFSADSTKPIRRHDARIRKTINYIIHEFFETQQDNAILYMCMDDDGRARNRHITFSRWFREEVSDLEKHNFIYRDKDTEFYSSIIIRSANPNRQHIIDAFYHTIDEWGL